MYTLCVCLCKCVVYLRKQHPLRLQIQTHPVTLVIQEVLQPQELDSTERAPVPPVHGDLQLPRLQDKATCSTSTQQHNAAAQRSTTTQQHNTASPHSSTARPADCRAFRVCYPVQFQCELLVPGLVAGRPPVRLSNHGVVQLQYSTDLICRKHTD